MNPGTRTYTIDFPDGLMDLPLVEVHSESKFDSDPRLTGSQTSPENTK